MYVHPKVALRECTHPDVAFCVVTAPPWLPLPKECAHGVVISEDVGCVYCSGAFQDPVTVIDLLDITLVDKNGTD